MRNGVEYFLMKTYKTLLSIRLIALATVASSCFNLNSNAAEATVADFFGKKSEELVSIHRASLLDAAGFSSNVDGQSNSWRRALSQTGAGMSVVLKSGRWERPDANEPENIWLSYDQDWSNVDTFGKPLRFHYEFDSSSLGATVSFRFGASENSRTSGSGDYALTLVFGGTSCVFSVNGVKTAGELPFEVGVGTKVTVDLFPDDTVSIMIDDLTVLSGQTVEFDENYVTLVLEKSSGRAVQPPMFLSLSNFKITSGN